MFESLHKTQQLATINETELASLASAGDSSAADALLTLRNIENFALWRVLQQAGCSADNWSDIIDAMLSPQRLAIGAMAKGLVPFHEYDDGYRTAVEEHCRSVQQLGFGNVHFTIKPSMVNDVTTAARKATSHDLDVHVSFQHDSTDTVSLNEQREIIRDASGEIAFKAGGHGSLLQNLMDTHGDLIFLRNIDNIVTESRFGAINAVRRQMGEHLLNIEVRVHAALHQIENGGDVDLAIAVLRDDFGLQLPPHAQPPAYYFKELYRPIRVCGVIKVQGDVGGGAYWTAEPGSASRVQIVESAQLTYTSDSQREIAARLAYFNPVDMVCSIKDHRGVAFNLFDFRDEDAVIVTRKSKNGRSVLAYEHPGLWNGGMARWNSVFVAIPAETFQPVKRLSDLLNPYHRNS